MREDRATRKLLVTRETPMGPYLAWDGLGSLCIAFDLAEQGKAVLN